MRGVPPSIMGIGPAFAIPAALKRAQLSKNEIDLYEVNEAFASQCVYCVKELGLSWVCFSSNHCVLYGTAIF